MGSEGKLYIKVMEINDELGPRTVVGLCDAELIGKIFREGEKVLNINEEFFKGMLIDPDEAVPYLEKAYTAMIVGRRAINIALKLRLIHPKAILKVSGIPYAQFVRI